MPCRPSLNVMRLMILALCCPWHKRCCQDWRRPTSTCSKAVPLVWGTTLWYDGPKTNACGLGLSYMKAKPREERRHGWGDCYCSDLAYGGRRFYRVRPVSTAVRSCGHCRDPSDYLPARGHRHPHGGRLFPGHQWPEVWRLHDAEWSWGGKRLWRRGSGLRRIRTYFALARGDGAAAAWRVPQFLPDAQL